MYKKKRDEIIYIYIYISGQETKHRTEHDREIQVE